MYEKLEGCDCPRYSEWGEHLEACRYFEAKTRVVKAFSRPRKAGPPERRVDADVIRPDNKLHLGYSPLSERIYLGRQNGNRFVGDKRDVTSEFIQVMLHKFEPGTIQNVTVGGEEKYRVLVVHKETKISVDGKAV